MTGVQCTTWWFATGYDICSILSFNREDSELAFTHIFFITEVWTRTLQNMVQYWYHFEDMSGNLTYYGVLLVLLLCRATSDFSLRPNSVRVISMMHGTDEIVIAGGSWGLCADGRFEWPIWLHRAEDTGFDIIAPRTFKVSGESDGSTDGAASRSWKGKKSP